MYQVVIDLPLLLHVVASHTSTKILQNNVLNVITSVLNVPLVVANVLNAKVITDHLHLLLVCVITTFMIMGVIKTVRLVSILV